MTREQKVDVVFRILVDNRAMEDDRGYMDKDHVLRLAKDVVEALEE